MTTPTTAVLELPRPGRWTAFGWFTFEIGRAHV